jgi:lariat debranching enzyme
LGSPPAEELLQYLKPSYWFSAHLHVKFAAVVTHDDTRENTMASRKKTKFLALDKCLPRRDFLQVLSLPASGPKKLQYDAEWLAITKATQAVCSFSQGYCRLPARGSEQFQMYIPTDEDMKAIRESFGGDLTIPCNFCLTSPVHNPATADPLPVVMLENPQTAEFCRHLGIENPFRPGGQSANPPCFEKASTCKNPDEILLSDTEEAAGNNIGTVTKNPDEIDLDNSDEDTVCEDDKHKTEQLHNEPEAKRSCLADINDGELDEGSRFVNSDRAG